MLERMLSKRKTPPFLVGVQTYTATLEMAVSQKIGNQSTSRPSNSTLGHIPKGCNSNIKDICSVVVIAALLIIARTWKQPRCPSTKEYIKTM